MQEVFIEELGVVLRNSSVSRKRTKIQILLLYNFDPP